MEEEKILYKKFLNGDEKAFNNIIEKNKKNLVYFISRYVKNLEVAEDIFQDVILYILENKEKYDFNYSLITYMYMIAKSRAINYINQNERIVEISETLPTSNLLEEIICSDERKEKIKNVINKLKLEYQLVIYLTQIEGLSYKETAKIMEKTENQIRTLAHNSKKKLKKLLIEENIVEIRNKKIIVLVCTLIFALAMVTGVTYADEIAEWVKEFFGANASDGVDTAVNHGFVATLDSNPQTSEGIEIKIASFMIDDYNFGMNFLLTVNDEIKKVKFKKVEIYDLRVTDENSETVFNTHISNFETEELKPKKYMGGYSFSNTTIDENNIKISLTASQTDNTFPKSKKLIAEFTKLKVIDEMGNEVIYEGDWKLEAEVPEEMYKREAIIYKVKSCNDDKTIVADAILTNTAFKISIPLTTTDKIDYKALYDRENMKSIYSLIALQKEYVKNANGQKFETSKDGNSGYGGASDQRKITDYYQTFNLTKYDATDELTVHIFTNSGEEIIIEYERVK